MTQLRSRDLELVSGGIPVPNRVRAAYWTVQTLRGLGAGAAVAATIHAVEEIDPFGLYTRLTK